MKKTFGRHPARHGGYRDRPTVAQRRFAHMEVMGPRDPDSCPLCEPPRPAECPWCFGTGRIDRARIAE